MLALLQSFQHRPRHVLSLLAQHFEVFLHRVKLRLQDALLQLRRLRYLAELVVRHDDTIVVVVLDIVEETHAVGGRKVLFRSVQNTCVGICRLIGGGNLRDIGFQPDNHRLVRQIQTLHFMCGDTHNQRLAGSHLMVTNSAAVLFQHPDTIHLRGIDAPDAPACQAFQIEVGESLVRAVILRAHETVELAVIHRRQPLLELRRLLFEPFGESVSYLVNLGVGELYSLAVAHLDVVAMLVLADGLHHVGAGVVQGVFQKVHTVIVPVIPLHQKLVRDFHGAVAARHRKLVHAGGVGDFHLRVEQPAHVGGIDTRRNPAFPEIEVQILEGDARRFGFFQSLQRLLHLRHTFTFGVFAHPSLYAFRLLYHVSGNKAVLNLVTGYERIVIDTFLQGCEQLLRRAVGYLPHIVEIDRAIFVERRGQGFFGRAYVGMALHGEGNRTIEDVRLDKLPVLRPFQRKDVTPSRVHHHQLHVLLGVEVAVTHDELIVTGVQMLTPLDICFV